ncbi:hypothetical protein [Aquimarina algiphila]|uniref:hypothetical protein n=1 Tax=Aquimarina algiphila TaxID=2047982 RepID=UPI002493AC30|nr:hypothetical protein [Aquimarina algiphila]
MRIIKLSIILVVFVLQHVYGQKIEMQKINFLIGTWKIEGKESYETWQNKDGKFTGESYKIRDEKKYVSEKLEIKLFDNNLVYIAKVFNQNEGKGIRFILKQSERYLFFLRICSMTFQKKFNIKLLIKMSYLYLFWESMIKDFLIL